MNDDPVLVHATAVAIGGRAVLLRGPSGSGKSDLALRLIDAGGCLVADDQSQLWRDGEAILVRAPQPIAGLIEVRGVGIVKVESLPVARLALIADLCAPQHVERLPEPSSETIFGLAIPLVAIAPFEASAPIKLRLALAAVTDEGTHWAVAAFMHRGSDDIAARLEAGHNCHCIKRDDEGFRQRYRSDLSPPAGRSGLRRHVDRTPRGLYPLSDRLNV